MSPTGKKPQQTSERQTTRPEKLRRVLNLPLAIGTLLAVVVLVPSLYFLHSWQIERMASRFLVRADELVAQENWDQASRHYSNYLRIRPKDVEQRVKLAETFAKTVSQSPNNAVQAIAIHRHAISSLRDDPLRQAKLRQSLLQLLLDAGEFRKAEIEVLAQPASLDSGAKDRHLPKTVADRRVLAQALFGRFLKGAISSEIQLPWPSSKPSDWKYERWALSEILKGVQRSAPGDPLISVPLATLYREHSTMLTDEEKSTLPSKRNDMADQIIATMWKTHANDVEVLLKSHLYYAKYDHADAEKTIADALRVGPKNPEVLLAAARFAHNQAVSVLPADMLPPLKSDPMSPSIKPDVLEKVRQQLTKSESLYLQVIAIEPAREEAYVELGRLLRKQGKTEEAIAVYEQGTTEIKNAPVLLALAVEGRLNLGQAEAVVSALEELESMSSDRNPLKLRSNSLLDLQRMVDLVQGKRWLILEEPAKAVSRLRQVPPGLSQTLYHRKMFLEAHQLLATAYRELQLWDQVAQAEESVLETELALDESAHRLSAAQAWRLSNQPGRAQVHYRLLLGQQDLPQVWFLLANAILEGNMLRSITEQNWIGFSEALRRASGKTPPTQDLPGESVVAAWRIPLISARARWMQSYTGAIAAGNAEVRREIEAELDSLVAIYPEVADVWQEAATLYQLIGSESKAIAAAEKVGPLSKNIVQGTVIEVTILARQEKLAEAQSRVLQRITQAENSEKTALRNILERIVIFQQQPKDPSGIGSGEAAVSVGQLDISTLLQFAEYDLAHGDQRVTQWRDKLQQREGPEGTTWKYVHARWLLAQLNREQARIDDPRIVELVRIQTELQRDRPDWSYTHLLKAMIAQGRNRPTEAIRFYRKSVELGERRVFVFEQLAKLMWATGDTDVETVLSKLGVRVPVDPKLSAISIVSATQNNQLAVAETRAQAAIANRADDPIAYLWLAQVFILQDNDEKARDQLTKATQIAPTNIQVWSSLVTFLTRRGLRDDAEEALAQLEKHGGFQSDAKKALVLAVLERQLGLQQKAELRLKGAMKVAKSDEMKVTILLQAAQLDVQQKKLDDAVRKLQLAMQLGPQAAMSRRMLATTLAARGKGTDYDRAIELLQQAQASEDQTTDERLRGLLLARRADHAYQANLEIAEDIYQQLVQNEGNAADRVFLARLYFVRSQLELRVRLDRDAEDAKRLDLLKAAEVQFSEVAHSTKPNVRHVFRYLRFLILQGRSDDARKRLPLLRMAMVGNQTSVPLKLARYGDAVWELGFEQESILVSKQIDDALIQLGNAAFPHDYEAAIRLAIKQERPGSVSRWMALLKRRRPEQLSTLTLEIKTGNISDSHDASSALDKFAARFLAKPENVNRKDALFLAMAKLAEENDRHDISEHWARRLWKENPAAFGALVDSLVSQGKFNDAIGVCESVMASRSSIPVAIAAATLAVQSDLLEPSEVNRVEQIIRELMQEFPDDVRLLIAVGTFRAKQQQVNEAIAMFQRARELSPNSVLVLNNLATLLAEVPEKTDEALRHIDHALMRDGVSGALLDTKGTVLIRAGRFTEARLLLEMACREPHNQDPRGLFHLAVALYGIDNRERAQMFLNQALAGGLEDEILTPSDQEDLETLRMNLQRGDVTQ